MAPPKIKIQYAVRNGLLVTVNNVERGVKCECSCASCGSPLTARKGDERTHHFAHVNTTISCSEESVLHVLSKRILRERIEESLAENLPLYVEWSCLECGGQHKVNLIKKAVTIKEEFDCGKARADLMLFKQKSRPYIAIEMIVTHSPELEAKEYYKNNKIVCVEFTIASNSDLDMLEKEPLLKASRVDHCLAERCSCGGIMDERFIFIVERACSRCKRSMKTAYGCFQWGLAGPEEFRSAEIRFAEEKGVQIERRFSKTVNDHYMANVCPRCHAFWGRHFLSDIWNNSATDPSTIVLLQCRKCSRTKEVSQVAPELPSREYQPFSTI